MTEYEEIDLEVIHPTQDAILLSDGEGEKWIPWSTVKPDHSMRWYDYKKGSSHTFEIATWKLEDVGFI